MRREGGGVLAALGAPGDLTLLATSALLFVATAAATLAWCAAMDGGMPMLGGWTMSMAWMRMPGQTWPAAALSFMAMWVLMMVAMMLPSLVPMLARFRAASAESDGPTLATRTAIAGAGYFTTWTALGACAYPLGVGIAAAAMRWPVVDRAVPLATGVVIALAGGVQVSAWKARQLGRCRGGACERGTPPRTLREAWRHGLGLGVDCVRCCAGWMAILLVSDVMDPGVMALVAAPITVERHATRPERVARTAGVVAIAAGVVAMARALQMG